jgi:transcriptional regulator with XRE-family HTH domain
VVEPLREFAQQLRSLREAQGLSVRALAGRVGVSSVTIWKWEKGESRPRVRLLTPLAEALDVAPNQLRSFVTGQDNSAKRIMPEASYQAGAEGPALPQPDEQLQVEVLADVIAKAKQMIAEVSGIGANNITIRIEY